MATAPVGFHIPYVGDIQKYLKNMGEPLKKCYETIQVPGEVQNRFLASLRTTIAIAAVCLDPAAAMTGNLTTVVFPSMARTITTKADDMLTGLWNGMTPNQRIAAVAAGIIVTHYGIPYLWIPAALCAAKVGAQLALENVNKELDASAIKKAKEEVQDKKF